MRKFSSGDSPNFERRDDPALLRRGGAPDTILLVEGYKLFVHSKIVGVSSNKIHRALLFPDPMFGKQIQFTPYNGRRRTKPGLIALLNAIYPPQLIPPEHLFDEVCNIAKEYGMELLLERLKLGIIANCELEPLLAAERERQRGKPLPDLVFDAFSEFSLDEFKSLDSYDSLETRTKVEVARRRVALLERRLAKKELEPVRTANKHLFRICPPELKQNDEDIILVADTQAFDLAASMGRSSTGSHTPSHRPSTAGSGRRHGSGEGGGGQSPPASNPASPSRRTATLSSLGNRSRSG